MSWFQDQARSTLANAICPNCHTLYGPGVQFERAGWRPRVTCPHCGHVSTSISADVRPNAVDADRLATATGTTTRETATSDKPPQSPIRVESRGFNAVEVVIPPRPLTPNQRFHHRAGLLLAGGFLVVPLWFAWQGRIALPLPALEPWLSGDLHGGLASLLPSLIVLGIPLGILWSLRRRNRDETERAATETRIQIDARELQFRESRAGAGMCNRSWPLAELQTIRVGERHVRRGRGSTRGRTRIIRWVELARSPGHTEPAAQSAGAPNGGAERLPETIDFGYHLTPAEQHWLAAELRRLVHNAGNVRVVPPQ